MAYCGSESTWATVEDLYERFGEEYIDKLAIRRQYNPTLEEYVADESALGIERVISLALCDAKNLLIQKLGCIYGSIDLLNQYIFNGVKTWHMQITIATLKAGGDCVSCSEALDLKAFIECGQICTDDGVCLPKKGTFVTVSESVFTCECFGRCGCC